MKSKHKVLIAPRNKSWGGISFPAKWGMPSILLVAIWLLRFQPSSLEAFGFFLAIYIPLLSLTFFLLLVPWQLRVENGQLWFRKWLYWQRHDEAQVEDVHRVVSVFGSIKLDDSEDRFIYVIEPDNEYLLESGRASKEGRGASTKGSSKIFLTCEVLSGVFGFISGVLWADASRSMGSKSINLSPTWLTTLTNLENRFSYLFAAAVIAVIAVKLARTSRQHGAERVIYSGILGVMIAELLLSK